MDIYGAGDEDRLERLYNPHRMSYITHRTSAPAPGMTGEPFLDIPRGRDDAGLVIARGEFCYALLNLYPYNSGHAMVVPYRKVANLEDLTPAESAEVMTLAQQLIVVIKAVSSPHAFNVGFNLGRAAGGSIAEHLHLHVVPRWSGDSNFITVLGGTKTLPQLLGQTRELLATQWATHYGSTCHPAAPFLPTGEVNPDGPGDTAGQ